MHLYPVKYNDIEVNEDNLRYSLCLFPCHSDGCYGFEGKKNTSVAIEQKLRQKEFPVFPVTVS